MLPGRTLSKSLPFIVKAGITANGVGLAKEGVMAFGEQRRTSMNLPERKEPNMKGKAVPRKNSSGPVHLGNTVTTS